jgi:hypothetical protein
MICLPGARSPLQLFGLDHFRRLENSLFAQPKRFAHNRLAEGSSLSSPADEVRHYSPPFTKRARPAQMSVQ